MNDAASDRNRIASSLLFSVMSLCVTGAANLEAAQSLLQRTDFLSAAGKTSRVPQGDEAHR